jgi:hypothetical protein
MAALHDGASEHYPHSSTNQECSVHDQQSENEEHLFFPYVEVQTRQILISPVMIMPSKANKNERFRITKCGRDFRDLEISDTLALGEGNSIDITVDDLVPLARQCDQLVFIESFWDGDDNDPLKHLVHLAKERESAASCTVALILALNFLESTIRMTSSNAVPRF